MGIWKRPLPEALQSAGQRHDALKASSGPLRLAEVPVLSARLLKKLLEGTRGNTQKPVRACFKPVLFVIVSAPEPEKVVAMTKNEGEAISHCCEFEGGTSFHPQHALDQDILKGVYQCPGIRQKPRTPCALKRPKQA